MDVPGLKARSNLPLLFVVMAFLVVGSILSIHWAGLAAIGALQDVSDHHTVVDRLERILSTLRDAERSERGYLLTADADYLGPYENALKVFHRNLAQLDRDVDQGRLAPADRNRIRALADAKLTELTQSIDLHRQGRTAEALAILREGRGRRVMESLVDEITQIQKRKTAEAQQALNTATRYSNYRTAMYFAEGAVMLGFMLWLYRRIRREMIERVSAMAEAMHQRLEAERQHDLFAVTLASIGDAVIVTDTQARIRFINEVAQALTGWSANEVFGQPCREVFKIVSEATRAPVENPVDRVLREGAVVGLANHTILVRKDGSEIPIDDSGAPIRGTDGQVQGVVLVFRDFTEHKNAERLLREAKEEAEQANVAKDNFLAALSHELRTPLTPVLATLADWENAEDIPPRMQPDVSMLKRNVELEARLIDDLLEMTRIVKGKLALRFEVADVHDLLNNVAAICRPDVDAKHLHLVLDLAAPRHHARADAGRLQQVFWNVLKNATKFTPQGGRIDISTTDENGRLRITFTDNGLGMSEETLARLFLPFQQGTEDIVRQYGGLGLGMAISKALVEAQGGEITATSPGTGQGSSFIITLPSVEAPSQPAPPAPELPAREHAALGILLVEDHRDTALVMKRILQRFGHEVTVAGSVAAALEAASHRDFDLLLSDIGLPDGTGIDLLAQIRQKQDVPAIALTGFGMEEDVARCLQAGFKHHLTKPLNFRELEVLLQQISAARNESLVASPGP